ncbi:hypothetical protein GII30_21295 [Gordonia amarae]|mgnify:CR=1 FL=1|uniref:6-phosphofructokinase n=2 Tax=Gordonia amarae TaxID=36821 RepID=G7GW95_9ACTN|nr:hypothetical protein [Gordonia amarae]MCS3880982.1 hypothetical protein [Gordonia amarae]QHN19223.1 hypothetical protein GII35_21590 [Gordonia amarae]QHN23699.1 hypothetical protein GII34_21090 [Gordonia amarae]QHN32611.1 hypothetical protein GII32_21420 [Gordonia amarae]QHN41359.1 hypothetical protein GII30_21295 [Gordonia amarae]
MSIDLTGGLHPTREHVFAERPENPEMRDSVSFWVVDDSGAVGLPRIGVEAVSSNWEDHDIQVNVTYPDGRIYRLRSTEPAVPPIGPEGKPTVLGSGGLAFRCVDEFDTWTMTYDGKATAVTAQGLIDGDTDGPLVDVSFHVDAKMAVPPWIQGTMGKNAVPESKNNGIEDDGINALMGGPRYEQLFLATGRIAVDGEPAHEFTGRGLRIRRQGVRKLAGFWGHCWQSAVFPSGKAFGYIAYPPRDDGQESYAEGYVFTGDGDLIPAEIVRAPWLTRLVPAGDDASLELRTADGTIRIDGEVLFGAHDVHHKDKTFSTAALKAEMPEFPVVHQAGVRYRWDGEEAVGMMERSNPPSKIENA